MQFARLSGANRAARRRPAVKNAHRRRCAAGRTPSLPLCDTRALSELSETCLNVAAVGIKTGSHGALGANRLARRRLRPLYPHRRSCAAGRPRPLPLCDGRQTLPRLRTLDGRWPPSDGRARGAAFLFPRAAYAPCRARPRCPRALRPKADFVTAENSATDSTGARLRSRGRGGAA